jgi:hypothetical protein
MSAIRHLASRGKRAALPLTSALLALALLAAPGGSHAETYTWNKAGGGNWDDAANWLPGTGYPGVGDTAIVSNNVATTMTISLNGDRSVEGLYIGGIGYTNIPLTTIAGNTLTLGAGGLRFYGRTQNATVSSALRLAADSSIEQYSYWPGQKDLNVNGAIATEGHTLALYSDGYDLFVNGAISGTGPVRASGSRSIYLRGANPATGPFVSGGAVYLDNNGTFVEVESVAVSGGTLTLGSSGSNAADDGVTTFGRLPNDVSATMFGSGAQLRLYGQNSVATTERLGPLELRYGNVRIDVESGSGSTATLAPASVSRSPSGRPVCFVYTGSRYNLGSGGYVVLGDDGAGLTQIGGDGGRTTNKKIVPWMLTRAEASYSTDSRFGGFTDMVTYDPVNGFAQMNGSTDYVNAAEEGIFPTVHADGDDNVRLPFSVVKPTNNQGSTMTLADDTTVNSLLIYNDAAASNSGFFTLAGAERRLTVKSGLILGGIRASTSRLAVNIDVAEIAFGSAEGIVAVPAQPYNRWDIRSALFGSNGITVYNDKSFTSDNDRGEVMLSGDNSGLTGPYTLIGGTVRAGHANALGDGSQPLVLAYGELQLGTSGNLTVSSVAGIGNVQRNWTVSGKRLNIGAVATVGDETVQLRDGGAIRPGFADRAGTVELRGLASVKLLGGTLELDLLLDGGNDQLYASGTPNVQIDGSSLVVALHAEPEVGAQFLAVKVAGTTAVSGQFAEGAEVVAEFGNKKVTFDVLYNTSAAGGDGNDIALRVADVAAPSGATVLLLR